ncbi:hypothetical protein BT96DRAFT_996979 [Gymnopus androsaceus JB14]|uniref:Glycoside hydrolase family 71 protein n=1 Tax=Gymnopus androsaceus JB14 TaxID=1447944 RepID=A0A6A4HEN9_9AGAR|nr:hypothetical protein BT96DRAFT_996979 [Gymnopus androsaceus JB14]
MHSFFLPAILVLVLPLLSLAIHEDSFKHSHHHSALSKHLHHRDDTFNTTERAKDADLQKRDDTKYVFMHHYTYDSWMTDFIQIAAKGVDAVALNVGRDDWQLKDGGLDYYANRDSERGKPSYFRIDGRPMISSYSGFDLGATGWQSIRDQTGGYLMPFIYGMDYQRLRSNSDFGFFDSWYCWGCAWPQGNYYKNIEDDKYYMDILGDRYATTVSAWFYTHYTYKNFYLLGDGWLLNNRWEELIAMRDQLTFAEIVTWNDYGESDYFGPTDNGEQPDGTTWAVFDHTPFFEMCDYYITAFKTGTYPLITDDTIYFWMRPHPAGIDANNDPLPKPTGWDWTSDTLWSAVFCSSTCSVTLQVGSVWKNFEDLPYGVNKIRLELNETAYGPVTVSMRKDGQEMIYYTTGDDGFQYRPTTEQYNYNAWVGFARASDYSPGWY